MVLKRDQIITSSVYLFRILSILVVLAGCVSGSNRAPVQDRGASASKSQGYHLVSKGETLFAIAWRYGLDYKALARRNGIGRGYVIYPGQKIYLNQTVKPARVVTKVVPSSSKPPTVKSPPKNTVRSKTPTSERSEPVMYTSKGAVKWQWPTQGVIIKKFSSQKSLNKGVDLDGRLGDSVHAAAAGQVVYAGNGIRGYGNLLIIKHSERFLSAYAHNSRLLVKEQSVVKAGQVIAEIGNSGTDQHKLHFEIRRDGKPVDPLQYLPTR